MLTEQLTGTVLPPFEGIAHINSVLVELYQPGTESLLCTEIDLFSEEIRDLKYPGSALM